MATLDASHTPPTTTAIVIATAIVVGVGGYFIGQGASLGLFGGSSRAGKRPIPVDSSDEEDEEDDDEDEGDRGQTELSDFAQTNDEYKLVLVVRTDLGMTKGKMAAQCSHATLACYKTLLRNPKTNGTLLRRWERQGQAKVALQVKDEEELLMLQAQAVSLGLCAQVVRDAGRTQIVAGSATVLGVGPGPKAVVDQVTGKLKLL
ncbi:MAG: hypothetical protein M1832_000419 [Thelocarpon impressellum]|nr:MAG: hypothetical protein M1832_000419 [Thelocarpon impressellum]